MEFNVIIQNDAYEDMRNISDYIALSLSAPQAAFKLIDKFEREFLRIGNFPFSGAKIRSSNFSLPYLWSRIDNYMIFYIVDEPLHTVYIMRILYGASDYLTDL